MKRISVFSLMLFFCLTISHAQKEDYLWLFGYSSDSTTMEFGGSNIDFNTIPPDIHYQYREMNFGITNASICDADGQLLFYSNGISIANALGEIMENGDSINPGPYREDWVDIGYNLYQGILILPLPETPNIYYVFHEERTQVFDDPEHSTKVLSLFYTIVDMSANDGLGKVVEKNVPLVQDTLGYGTITATKHANGSDWWIIIPAFDSNQYYRILFSSNGIESIDLEEEGNMVHAGLGQATFSPDGTKYASYILESIELGNFLSIYDFDRCTGLLSNQQQFNIIDSAYAGGVAISPNSRYLYVSSFVYTYQYDLQAADIGASKTTVAVYDGHIAPYFPTTFFLAQLAPDGKIYINSNNGVNELHVIHEPDQAGDACNFEQHGVSIPTYNAFSLPNFPNYRLGPAPDADSCGLVNTSAIPLEDIPIFTIYPNPSTGLFNLSCSQHLSAVELIIFDQFGRIIFSKDFDTFLNETTIDLSNYATGIYFWELRSNAHSLGKGKLVKL